jgi:hypothetical protein
LFENAEFNKATTDEQQEQFGEAIYGYVEQIVGE